MPIETLSLRIKSLAKAAGQTSAIDPLIRFCLLCLNSKGVSKEETVITHWPGIITHCA
jgi:hypothetical protein